MVRLALLALTLTLAGCYMSNDDIVAEVAKCNQAGTRAEVGRGGLTGRVLFVQCVPKDEK